MSLLSILWRCLPSSALAPLACGLLRLALEVQIKVTSNVHGGAWPLLPLAPVGCLPVTGSPGLGCWPRLLCSEDKAQSQGGVSCANSALLPFRPLLLLSILLGALGMPSRQSDYHGGDVLERSCEEAAWRQREMPEEPQMAQHLAGPPEIMEQTQVIPAVPSLNS